MTLKPIPSEEVTAHPETQPSTDIISILKASPCSGTLPEAQPREDVQQAGPKTSSPVSVQPMSPHQTEGHEHLPSVETEKHGLENEVQKLVSAVESQSEQLSDLNKAQGTRRARLPKLKPNLGRGGRTSVSLSGWSTTQPEPGPSEKKPTLGDLATQILDASKAPRRKAKRPLGGAKTHPETTAEIPPEIPAEDSSSHPGASTPATDEFDNTEPGPAPFVQDSQSYPILTTNSEVPVDLAFPDPEEPYFILSLTEIPVFPTEEEMTPVSEAVSEAVSEPVSEPVPEPLPHLHAPDISSSQPHSSHVAVSGSDMAKESHAVLWNVPVPTTAQEGDVITTPSDEEVRSRVGADTQVESDHPSEEPVAKDNQELEKEEQEVDPPPKKRKLPAKSRKAAKPASTVRKQSDRTTSSAQTQKQTRSEPELSPSPCSAAPCPPAHTQASPTQHVTPGETSGPVRPSDLTNIEEDTPTGMGGEIEDKAEAVRGVTPLATTSPLSRPGRRSRGFLSYMADKGSPAPTGGPRGPIAASKRPQLNTSRPGRKRGDPVLTSSTNSPRPPAEVEASDTPDTNAPCILPVPGISNPPGLSTVQSTAADEEREGMAPAEEESINVSQFFFSDIFTEVEENEG